MSDDKTILITGASSGIGAASAELFSQRGFRVFLLARRQEQLQAVASRCPNETQVFQCDLGDEKSSLECSHKVKEALGTEGLAGLVNNAGIFQRQHFESTSDVEWEKQFHVNLLGSIRITRLLLPELKKPESASIVNVSSTLGIKPMPGTSAYSAMKAAMINWSQCLALELAPQIRVNTVCPGIVHTPIHDFYESSDSAAIRAQVDKLQPLKRIGTPEEIAESIFFLTSESSRWTTGAVLNVDGGINLGGN